MFWSLTGKPDHYVYVIVLDQFHPFSNNINTDIIVIRKGELQFEDAFLWKHQKKKIYLLINLYL